MWFFSAASIAVAFRLNTHCGVCAAHTNVCPRTIKPFCVAKLTSVSAPEKLNCPWFGSVPSHWAEVSPVL